MRFDVSILVSPSNSGLVTYLAHSNGAFGAPYQFEKGLFYRQDYTFLSQKSIFNFLKQVDEKIGLENDHLFRIMYIEDDSNEDKGDERA